MFYQKLLSQKSAQQLYEEKILENFEPYRLYNTKYQKYLTLNNISLTTNKSYRL